MVIKMTNKDKNFYKYMGRFFGSRAIEKQINDRIYDDDGKQWYMFFEGKEVKAFVSVNKNIIKNIYATEEKYLEDVLKAVIKENEITYSTVIKMYADVYKKCGFKVSKETGYKNFVMIYVDNNEAIA